MRAFDGMALQQENGRIWLWEEAMVLQSKLFLVLLAQMWCQAFISFRLLGIYPEMIHLFDELHVRNDRRLELAGNVGTKWAHNAGV